MNTPDNTPWNLIQKALNKSLDVQERKELDDWLSESESNRSEFQKITVAWNLTGSKLKRNIPDKQAAWERIVQEAGIAYTEKRAKEKRREKVLFFVRNVAAILLLSLMMTTAILFVRQWTPSASPIVSVHTEMGQRSHFVLEDDTKIWLNSDSELHNVSTGKNGETRLRLDGEAYFETPGDRSGNLIVTTSHKDVKVTGTAFNVRAYPGEDHIETVLVNGSVDLLAPERIAEMKPGQRAAYNKTSSELEISEINTFEYIAWREGILVFRNVSFDELTSRLEKWFDVQIEYDSDQFNDAKYSGTFRNRENIDQVLTAVKATTPFEYRTENNRIIINKQ